MRGKRAVTDEQKALRYQQIIDAAASLFELSDFTDISMANIAKEAGVGKGTLFLYFRSKEDVFLSLARQRLEQWFDHVDRQLEHRALIGCHSRIKQLVDLLVSSLADDVLVRLMVILDDTLERNIAPVTERAFKLFLKKRMIRSGGLLEQCLPGLEPGNGAQLFHLCFMCLVGVYKVCTPSPLARAVIEKPGLEMFNLDFWETLEKTLTCLIKGFWTSKLM